MKQARASSSGFSPGSPSRASMYAWAWISSSAVDRGRGGRDASRSTYSRRTRSITCSASPVSSRAMLPSARPAAASQQNRAASRGSPASPGIPTAVRRETLPACLPSVALGTRITSRSNGASARKMAGCEVS